MSKKLLVVAAVLGALAFAGTAAAAGNGATVVSQEICTPIKFGPVVLGTTCIVTKTTTNTTTTKSGITSYQTNGTKDTTTSFVWGDVMTRSSEIHLHNLFKDGQFFVSSDHYEETWGYDLGSQHISCIEAYDTHWANGQSQFGDFVLECHPV
jgi:hypothetical protein